ncbi:MAG: helix-turn-helix transcriptional regulator [Pseudomonadota bacterium]
MSKPTRNLGEFEILVLSAIVRLDDNAYGVTIRREIESTTGRSVAVGALYATLARLAEKGLVSSRTGGATDARGGRSKRFYRLTAAGQSRLRNAVRSFERMFNGLPLEPR